jgi:hypothetical protein
MLMAKRPERATCAGAATRVTGLPSASPSFGFAAKWQAQRIVNEVDEDRDEDVSVIAGETRERRSGRGVPCFIETDLDSQRSKFGLNLVHFSVT